MVSIESDEWTELRSQYDRLASGTVYKLIDIDSQVDIRYAITYPSSTRAILIQLEDDLESLDILEPKWKGLKIYEIFLDTPKPETRHLVLELAHEELLDIFSRLISDIIEEVMIADSRNHAYESLRNCLNLWNYFFRKCGPEGLSKERQRGLLGELIFLKTILDNDGSALKIVNSWKGCERDFHDFQTGEQSIEIKTTMGKEPLNFIVSSERQLNDIGLKFLYLGVTHLSPSHSGGISLNQIINDIKNILKGTGQPLIDFEDRLFMAGYLKVHEKNYNDQYAIIKKFFFRVTDDFPRIISIPVGVGDLTYSITLSSCNEYQMNEDDVINEWMRVIQNG